MLDIATIKPTSFRLFENLSAKLAGNSSALVLRSHLYQDQVGSLAEHAVFQLCVIDLTLIVPACYIAEVSLAFQPSQVEGKDVLASEQRVFLFCLGRSMTHRGHDQVVKKR